MPVSGVGTLCAMFQNTVRAHGGKAALKARAGPGWRTITYEGYADYVRRIAGFLVSEGVRKGDAVAILGPNSPEWAIADFATLHAGAVTVPIYETLARDKVEHIVNDSACRLAFALRRDHADALLGVKAKGLERVVVLEPPSETDARVVPWEAALASGDAWLNADRRAFEERWRSVAAEDRASLVYTSGTTGIPKGVVLTHANLLANVQAALSVVPVTAEDEVLSFLPLSHVLERMAGHFAIVYAGGTIWYARSVETVPDDLVEAKPTILISVPRVYEKMEARIRKAVREAGRERIFERAVAVGRDVVRRKLAGEPAPLGLRARHRLLDKLVLRKIRVRTGGRLRFFVSGGAHIRQDLEELFWAAGLPILGGYGLTETSPVVSVNTLEHVRFGSVGRPLPGVDVRIAEDGEILVAGASVTQGYHNLPRETAESFETDPEGKRWLRTGDLGKLDADGFLYVTDRKKELLVLSNGKKVAPQPIEDLLTASEFIAQAIVIGDDKPYCVALLVPDFERLREWAAKEGVPATRESLARSPRIAALVQKEVETVNAKLSRFETIKAFTLLDHEFRQEEGELTPTLKLRRKVIQERYGGQIARLYSPTA